MNKRSVKRSLPVTVVGQPTERGVRRALALLVVGVLVATLVSVISHQSAQADTVGVSCQSGTTVICQRPDPKTCVETRTQPGTINVPIAVPVGTSGCNYVRIGSRYFVDFASRTPHENCRFPADPNAPVLNPPCTTNVSFAVTPEPANTTFNQFDILTCGRVPDAVDQWVHVRCNVVENHRSAFNLSFSITHAERTAPFTTQPFTFFEERFVIPVNMPTLQKPVAQLDVTQTGPLSYSFDGSRSYTTALGATILRYDWYFNSIKVSEAPKFDFTFARPNKTTVELVITDDRTTASDPAVYQIDSNADPKLNVTIEGADLLRKKAQTVNVVVSAVGGNRDLTNVRAVGDLLGSDPATGTVSITQPTGADAAPFTLSPGASKRIPVLVTGLKEGPVTLLSNWKGTGANGDATGSLSKATTVGVDELAIKLTFSENDFELDEDAAGPKPKLVTVTADIKNTLAVPVDGVTIDPKPTLKTASGQPLDPFPIDVTQQALPSADLGTLNPGETKTVTYKLNVTDDIAAIVRLFAIGTTRTGQRADGSVDAPFTAKPKYDAYLEVSPDESRFRGSNPAMTAGESMALTLRVRNLTTEKKVFLLPLVPDMNGTGVAQGGGVPVDLSKFSPTDPGSPPFGGDLPANRATPELLRTIIRTIPNGPNVKGFLQVGYTLRPFHVEDDGSLTPIAQSRVLVKDGSGPYRVIINPNFAPPGDIGIFNGIAHYTGSLILRSIEIAIGLGQGIGWAATYIATNAPNVAVDAMVPQRVFLRQAELVSDYWSNLTDIQRQDILGTVLVDMERQYGEPVANAYDAIGASVYEWFLRWDKAIEDGQPAVLADMQGALAADLTVGTVGVDGAMRATAQALVRAKLLSAPWRQAKLAEALARRQAQLDARMPDLISEFRRADLIAETADARRAARSTFASQLENGEILSETAASDVYRLGPGSGLTTVAKTHKLLITTSPLQDFARMFEHVAELGIVPVDGIDTLFLGARQADVGTIAVSEGLSRAEIDQIVATVRIDYGDDVARLVQERADRRYFEVRRKGQALVEYAKEGMPLANTAGERAKVVLQNVKGGRAYGLAPGSEVTWTRVISQPTVRTADGFKTISQNLSVSQVGNRFIDIRMADGLAIPPGIRGAVIRDILNSPDTVIPPDVIWELLGKADTTVNPNHAAILAASKAGAATPTPALAQIGPDGVIRAVRVVTGATDVPSPAANYVHFLGGFATFEDVIGTANLRAFPAKVRATKTVMQTTQTAKGSNLVSFATDEVPAPGSEYVIDANTPTEETVRVAPAGVGTAVVASPVLALASGRTMPAFAGWAGRNTGSGVSPGAAVRLASQGVGRALNFLSPRAQTSTPADDGTVTIQLTAPLRFDHSAGAFWQVPADVIRSTSSTTTTSPSTSTTSTTSTTAPPASTTTTSPSTSTTTSPTTSTSQPAPTTTSTSSPSTTATPTSTSTTTTTTSASTPSSTSTTSMLGATTTPTFPNGGSGQGLCCGDDAAPAAANERPIAFTGPAHVARDVLVGLLLIVLGAWMTWRSAARRRKEAQS